MKSMFCFFTLFFTTTLFAGDEVEYERYHRFKASVIGKNSYDIQENKFWLSFNQVAFDLDSNLIKKLEVNNDINFNLYGQNSKYRVKLYLKRDTGEIILNGQGKELILGWAPNHVLQKISSPVEYSGQVFNFISTNQLKVRLVKYKTSKKLKFNLKCYTGLLKCSTGGRSLFTMDKTKRYAVEITAADGNLFCSNHLYYSKKPIIFYGRCP